jgi:hypothetical protein
MQHFHKMLTVAPLGTITTINTGILRRKGTSSVYMAVTFRCCYASSSHLFQKSLYTRRYVIINLNTKHETLLLNSHPDTLHFHIKFQAMHRSRKWSISMRISKQYFASISPHAPFVSGPPESPWAVEGNRTTKNLMDTTHSLFYSCSSMQISYKLTVITLERATSHVFYFNNGEQETNARR